MSTNGGDEYCGQVIGEAIKRLDWSSESNAYKTIFIAGNEPFTQGSVDYQKSCRSAIESGIVVNTIHCGAYQNGVSGKWKHGAELAEGEYMNINQDRKVVHIDCPQDKIIIQLNTKLNQTYLWYGEKKTREFNTTNQAVQDKNALQIGGGGGLGVRAISKSSAIYNNVGRCIVDTFEKDKDILKKIKVDQLPDEMKKMSPEQRLKHVEKKAKERAEIKSQIAKLAKERAEFIAKKRAEQAANEGKAGSTLGDAMTQAVRNQLKKSGFEIKK